MSKLIIIRGPSGSGKSTIATALQNAYSTPTLLLHEDQLRFMFSNWKEPNNTATKKLAVAAILSGLNTGFDVIYEGISNIKTYAEYFEQILQEHPDDNYFFYLDVSFEESLKRHQTRPQKSEFGPDEMKRWLEYASPSGYDFETIIPGSFTIENSVQKIIEVTG